MDVETHYTIEGKVHLSKALKNCIDSLCKNSTSKMNLENNLDLMIVLLHDNFGIFTKHSANTFLTKIITQLYITKDESRIFDERGAEIILFFDFMDFIEKFRLITPDKDFYILYSPTQKKMKVM